MANSSKYNAEQFANMNLYSAGIIFVYEGKDGKDTAMHFFGKEYEMTAKTQNELLRVMRNLKTTLWMVKEKETELREKNDGIRCKYRSSTPAIIYVNLQSNERAKVYKTECSDFSKFGFFPTQKDLERSARDKKKYIHSSTIAMLEALNFRVEFPKTETAPVETAAQNAAPVVEPVAEVVAENAAPVDEVVAPVDEVATEPVAEVANETTETVATVQPATAQGNSDKGRNRRRTANKPTETTVETTTEITAEMVAA